MIPCQEFSAEFQCGREWQPCKVIGVTGEEKDLRFIVIVSGPMQYVDTVPR
jgi:hypothetical protein